MAAVGEVLPLPQQALVQLAGEQGDAVDPGVVPKPMTSHADLAATGGQQDCFIKKGPVLAAVIACG